MVAIIKKIIEFFGGEKAHITGTSGVEVDLGVKGYGCIPVIHGYRANGPIDAPTNVVAGDLVFGIGSRTWAGTGFTDHSTSAIHMVALENHSSSAQGTDFRILVTPVGSSHDGRKQMVQYLASPTGLRARMRLSGPDTGRLMFQTDEVGANTSVCAIPHAGMAANFQARDSHTPDFGRLFFEANATSNHRIVSDAGGNGVVRPVSVVVGSETSTTFSTDGSVTHHKGVRLGAASPKMMAKFFAVAAPPQGQTTVVAHGLDASKILGLHPIARQSSGVAVPPGVSFSPAGVQYEVRFDAQNVVVSMHPSNSSALVGAQVSVLVIYAL